MTRVSLIGYGEVGRILAEDLRAAGVAVSAFDRKLKDEPNTAGRAMQTHAQAHGVALRDSLTDALRDAELVVSAVTASQTLRVAELAAGALRSSADTGAHLGAQAGGGPVFLDVNSASPGTKQRAATLIDAAGGRYVEGAVMTSLPPYRIKVPLLLGGPHAHAVLPWLQQLGFAPEVTSSTLGVASATKMCRSVMIKGLEAMVIECLTTARHHGVEDAVIASLHETFPSIDWNKQAAYFFQRVIEHGRRRSEEVREVAATVAEAGLAPLSASGTAERQAWVADLADAGHFGRRGEPAFARSADWRVEADRILQSLHTNPTGPR